MDIDRIAKSVWLHARNLAILPVVLLVALYSAFGIVFIAVPAKFVKRTRHQYAHPGAFSDASLAGSSRPSRKCADSAARLVKGAPLSALAHRIHLIRVGRFNGLDPIPWTHSERRIRCPRWCNQPTKNRRPRRQFDDEFKAGAVRLVLDEGQTVGRVARDLDLTESALRNWVDRARADRTTGRTGLTSEEREELRRLRKENRRLRVERDVFDRARAEKSRGLLGARRVKKSRGLLREGKRVRFAFIQAEKATVPLAHLCQILNVSRSGFYAWACRPPSAHAHRDQQLRVLIRASHEASRRTYGSPRIHRDLQDQGHQVSRKRTARLPR